MKYVEMVAPLAEFIRVLSASAQANMENELKEQRASVLKEIQDGQDEAAEQEKASELTFSEEAFVVRDIAVDICARMSNAKTEVMKATASTPSDELVEAVEAKVMQLADVDDAVVDWVHAKFSVVFNAFSTAVTDAAKTMGKPLEEIRLALDALIRKDEPPLETMNNLRKSKEARALGVHMNEVDLLLEEFNAQLDNEPQYKLKIHKVIRSFLFEHAPTDFKKALETKAILSFTQEMSKPFKDLDTFNANVRTSQSMATKYQVEVPASITGKIGRVRAAHSS